MPRTEAAGVADAMIEAHFPMPKPPKCRIAIYAFVSILDQDPQMQLRELRAYAKHRTFTIAHKFIDPTFEGVGKNRTTSKRSLQADGVCSFILADYWYLYLRILDQGSPVHNFATVRELRPLDAESGRILASEPMARLGITYADPTLPTNIVQHTGRYPSLIQCLCDQLLKQLERDRTLVITPAYLAQVEQSQAVHNHLVEFFHMNTGSGTQLTVYPLLAVESFTQSEAHESLERSVRKTIPLWVIDQILLQLTPYGLVTKTGNDYRWTIPLGCDTLLTNGARTLQTELGNRERHEALLIRR